MGISRAVFIDRDGVINRTYIREGKGYPPASLAEFVFLDGVPEAVRALKAAGYLTIIATNQPDVSKGIQKQEVVEEMNKLVADTLKVDAVKVCYHVEKDGCSCRKPKPGMLLEAAKDWEIDYANSFMVGDRWCDIEAGKAAGCKTIMIGNGYVGEKTAYPNHRVASLLEAAKIILS